MFGLTGIEPYLAITGVSFLITIIFFMIDVKRQTFNILIGLGAWVVMTLGYSVFVDGVPDLSLISISPSFILGLALLLTAGITALRPYNILTGMSTSIAIVFVYSLFMNGITNAPSFLFGLVLMFAAGFTASQNSDKGWWLTVPLLTASMYTAVGPFAPIIGFAIINLFYFFGMPEVMAQKAQKEVEGNMKAEAKVAVRYDTEKVADDAEEDEVVATKKVVTAEA